MEGIDKVLEAQMGNQFNLGEKTGVHESSSKSSSCGRDNAAAGWSEGFNWREENRKLKYDREVTCF